MHENLKKTSFSNTLSIKYDHWNWRSSIIRPLQFNYLSYELFLEKKSCQTQKKSHLRCLTDESGFEIFLSDSKKKKKKKCKF